MHDLCEGEYTQMGSKTLEKQTNGLKASITNFPIQICPCCNDHISNLGDGVMVDIYLKQLVNSGLRDSKIEVDFLTIAKIFEGKDLCKEAERFN